MRISDWSSDVCSSDLATLIGSKSFEKYVLLIQTGTGVPHISATQIKGFVFPLPSVEEQRRIVGRTTKIKSGCSDLAEGYQAKLAGLNELNQSLLQKAFAGELT